MTDDEARFSGAVSALIRCNPFSPKWVKWEQSALGSEYVPVGSVHRWHEEKNGEHPNLAELEEKTKTLVERLGRRFSLDATTGRPQRTKESVWYENLVYYQLYRAYRGVFSELIRGEHNARPVATLWTQFRAEYGRLLPEERFPRTIPPDHLFAWFYQIRRAFDNIFERIVGNSKPAINLRRDVWESIFGRDMRRFVSGAYRQIGDVTMLILGPSGTGKELVAQAVGLSQYIPFDQERQGFAVDAASTFHAVNVAALTPSLVGSELFGHCKGAFTGATEQRAGWLGICGEHSTLFLDEIGDLDCDIQAKLLRVLETREYQRVGETATREFKGRIIAATNRDLAKEMRAGRFRRDLYYRLCSNVVRTPSLRRQLQSHDDDESRQRDLFELVTFIIRKIQPATGGKREEKHAQKLTQKVLGWIDQKLPKEYRWPGNIRELEHCVRSIVNRGRYRPVLVGKRDTSARTRQALVALARLGQHAWTEEKLLDVYTRLVYEAHGRSYKKAAEILGVDWRTAKNRVQSHSRGHAK